MTKRDRIVFSTKPQNGRKTAVLIGVLCLVLLCVGSVWFFFFRVQSDSNGKNENRTTNNTYPKTPTQGSLPDVTPDKILCDREGGKYVQIPEGTAQCLARTQDGGETCSNKSDCESNCLATADSASTGTGLCDEFVQPAGSRSLVSDGKLIKNVVE